MRTLVAWLPVLACGAMMLVVCVPMLLGWTRRSHSKEASSHEEVAALQEEVARLKEELEQSRRTLDA